MNQLIYMSANFQIMLKLDHLLKFKNVIIGKNTTISSHSFVCELAIGENCFISHGVMFTNDLFKNGKLGGSKEKWKPTKIGNVLIGSNSTILPIEICMMS